MNCTTNVFKTFGLAILLMLMPLLAMAQNVTVKGQVSDSEGPVIGATVKVRSEEHTSELQSRE